MTVQEALAGYEASDEDVIKSQTGFAMYDSQTGWVGNLSYLEPGKGYMLFRKAGSDVSFFYPVQGGTLSESAFAEASDGILLRSGGGSCEGTGNSQLLNPLQSDRKSTRLNSSH